MLGLGSAMHLGCTTMNPSVPAESRRTVSSQADARHVAVVGGGFVGLSCALHLQRSGYKVTLFDSASLAGPASASFGNAGQYPRSAPFPAIKRVHCIPFFLDATFGNSINLGCRCRNVRHVCKCSGQSPGPLEGCPWHAGTPPTSHSALELHRQRLLPCACLNAAP